MIKDPYILEDGTLKNLLGIEDYELLKLAEADIGFSKLIDIDKELLSSFNTDLFKNLHKHIFSEIYDWAGEFRTVSIFKEEVVIPGLSIDYSEVPNIASDLENRLLDLNKIDWKDKNVDTISLEFSKKLAAIWKVHPFRDGNTRTTLAFADMYSRVHGFPFNMGMMLDQLTRKQDENGKITQYSIRDKFVLAALDEKDYPEPEHLAVLFKEAIKKGALPKLHSDDREER